MIQTKQSRSIAIILVTGLFGSLIVGCGTTSNGAKVGVDDAAIGRLPGDRLIVPGQRVGPVYLGSTLEAVEAAIGPFDDTGTFVFNPGQENERRFEKRIWGRYGLSVMFGQSDPHARICVIYVFSSPRWRTAENLGVDTLFRDAINKINETRSPLYQSTSSPAMNGYPAQSHAFDSGGMEIENYNSGRDYPLDEIIVYDPTWSNNTPFNRP